MYIYINIYYIWGFPSGSGLKNPPAMWETQVQSLDWEDPWWRTWKPTPVFCRIHGQRSLVGYSP